MDISVMTDRYVGKTYGRLTVVRVTKIDGVWSAYCECACGNKKLIRLDNLRTGKVKSCGCLRNESLAHMKVTDDMKRECLLLRASGLSYAKIADRLFISRNTVFLVCKSNEDIINRLMEEARSVAERILVKSTDTESFD